MRHVIFQIIEFFLPLHIIFFGMTYDQILNDLKNKIYKPVYLLYGEESYFIDKITDYIAENVLTEQEKAFNQTIIYGRDTNVTAVIQAAPSQ